MPKWTYTEAGKKFIRQAVEEGMQSVEEHGTLSEAEVEAEIRKSKAKLGKKLARVQSHTKR